MKIKETPLEKKQRLLLKKYRNKKTVKRTKRKKKPPLESEKYLRTLSYGEFLTTKYWMHVRKLVFKRDNYKCVICKQNGLLQVHHDSYKNHFKELEHLEDLMTLCYDCHKEHHYAQN